MFQFESKGRKKSWCPNLRAVRKKEFHLTQRKLSLFCSMQAFYWLDEAHPRLLYSTYQFLLISSPDTFTNTPIIMFDQISGHPVASKLTHKINHHTRRSRVWSLERPGPGCEQERHRMGNGFEIPDIKARSSLVFNSTPSPYHLPTTPTISFHSHFTTLIFLFLC